MELPDRSSELSGFHNQLSGYINLQTKSYITHFKTTQHLKDELLSWAHLKITVVFKPMNTKLNHKCLAC